MNIFHLHKTPRLCAKFLSEVHLPKMVLETTQMLCTAYQKHKNKRINNLYKPAYPKHPMTIWVGENSDNYEWTLELLKWLLVEYTNRFNKLHKCSDIYNILRCNGGIYFTGTFTEPPLCMPVEFHQKNYVKAYRHYYKVGKSHLHRYKRAKKPRFLK